MRDLIPLKKKFARSKLNEEELQWMKANFSHYRNEICAIRLGIHRRTVSRIARKLGVNKTHDFMKEMQRYSSRMAAQANKLKNENPNGWKET